MGANPEEAVDGTQFARRMLSEDRAAASLGMRVVQCSPGSAIVTMKVTDDMVNGHAITHGGLVFALADTAFALACNSYGRATVAAGATIAFLAPTRAGDELVARAVERLRRGRRGLYDVTVRSGDEVVAEFRGNSAEITGRSL